VFSESFTRTEIPNSLVKLSFDTPFRLTLQGVKLSFDTPGGLTFARF